MRLVFYLLFLSSLALGLTPEEGFFGALKVGNRELAAKYRRYFGEGAKLPAEVWAQYYLLMCQHQSLKKAIERTEEGEKKKLFEAVQSSLLSVQRVKENVSLAPKKTTVKAPFVFQVPGEEIWADEWDILELTKNPCLNPPVARTPEGRAQHFERARKLFDEVSETAFLKDFSLLALALDVSYVPRNAKALLENYQSQKDHPYYQRLKELSGEKLLDERVKATQEKNEVNLTTLTLKISDFQPRVVETPYLLDVTN